MPGTIATVWDNAPKMPKKQGVAHRLNVRNINIVTKRIINATNYRFAPLPNHFSDTKTNRKVRIYGTSVTPARGLVLINAQERAIREDVTETDNAKQGTLPIIVPPVRFAKTDYALMFPRPITAAKETVVRKVLAAQKFGTRDATVPENANPLRIKPMLIPRQFTRRKEKLLTKIAYKVPNRAVKATGMDVTANARKRKTC